MDQAAISGVGNIFRAESLYRQEIDPLRPGKSLSDEELKRLWEDNKHLLVIGVRVGRIITTEPEDRPGVPETEAWPDHATTCTCTTASPAAAAEPLSAWKKLPAANSTGAPAARSSYRRRGTMAEALLVVDVQRGFLHPQLPARNNDGAEEKMQRLWRISAVQGAK